MVAVSLRGASMLLEPRSIIELVCPPQYLLFAPEVLDSLDFANGPV